MTQETGVTGGRFRLGTRGSPLAIAQAQMVATALQAAHDLENVEIVTVQTSGDRVNDRSLADLGGKALWTRELDRALLDGRVEACVHSMKDVETTRSRQIVVAAMLPRADVRDRLIGAPSIAALPNASVVGTSSPRRAAQLRHWRPDLHILPIRGNIATRLGKVDRGDVDATILAAAGLDRLDQRALGITIPTEIMLPPAGQGAIGIETLSDSPARSLVAAIDHQATSMCVFVERELLAFLGAGCRSPVGALATVDADGLMLRAELLSEDGNIRVHGAMRGALGFNLAREVARDLLSRAPPAILDRLFDSDRRPDIEDASGSQEMMPSPLRM